MNGSKPVSTPMEFGKSLVPGENDFNIDLYLQAVGSIMYLMTWTRPDISYPIGTLATFNASPTKEHWQGTKRILRYIEGTKDTKLVLGGKELTLERLY